MAKALDALFVQECDNIGCSTCEGAMADKLVEHNPNGHHRSILLIRVSACLHCPAEAAEARLRWKGLLASCTSVSVSVPRMASPQTPKPCPVPDSPHNTESLHALRQYEAFQGNHAICVAYRKAAWSLGCSSLANQQKSVKPVVFLVSCGLAQVFAGSRCSLASKMISSCREDVQRLTGTSWNQEADVAQDMRTAVRLHVQKQEHQEPNSLSKAFILHRSSRHTVQLRSTMDSWHTVD